VEILIVQYSPQVHPKNLRFSGAPEADERRPVYTFQGESVAVTIDGQTGVYDLSGCPEGGFLSEAQPIGEVRALLSAMRIDGQLQVQLWYPIGDNATEAERFPQPFEPGGETLPEGEAMAVTWDMPPEPEPGADERIAVLEDELLISYLAQAEMYEQMLSMQAESLMTMEALAEIYEIMIGG